MKQLKAVVLEKKGTMVTILAADGSFQKIRYRKPVEVGAEIEIAEVRRQQPFWRAAVSIAAVFLLTFLGSMSWNFYQAKTAVAMVSLDINPRIQFTINSKGEVLQSESLNPDAERILGGLQLKGEDWHKALDAIIDQSVSLHYLNSDDNWVLVGYSPLKQGSAVPQGVTLDDIAQRIDVTARAQGMEPKIAVYQLSAEDQTQAQENGLTLGEFALMNTAQNVGIQADASTVKNTEERAKLLEQPQVQKQLNKENRIQGLLKDKKMPTEGNSPGSPAQNDKNNDSKQNKGHNPGNLSDPQSGNHGYGPADSAPGFSKQENNQGEKAQGKIREKAMDDSGKPAKLKNDENKDRGGSGMPNEQ